VEITYILFDVPYDDSRMAASSTVFPLQNLSSRQNFIILFWKYLVEVRFGKIFFGNIEIENCSQCRVPHFLNILSRSSSLFKTTNKINTDQVSFSRLQKENYFEKSDG
jgi:hypothetical protein